MTARYDNSQTDATANAGKDLPLFSMWSKLASKNGPDNNPEIVTLRDLVLTVTGPDLKPVTQEYQTRLEEEGKTQKLKSWAAANLPGFGAGTYDGKGADYLTEFAPWIVGDIDGIRDDAELVFTYEELAALPYVALVYVSKSGRGLRFVALTDARPDTFQADELAVLQAAAESLSLQIDEGKDGPHLDTSNNGTPRPWLLNYSPEELTYCNFQPETFCCPRTPAAPVMKGNRKEAVNRTSSPSHSSDRPYTDEEHQFITEYLIQQIERDGKDITASMSRDQWVSLAASLATQFGEIQGFEYFDRLSRNYVSGKKVYDEVDAQKLIKEQALKRVGSIGTFYNVCKVHGYRFADALKDKWKQDRKVASRRAPAPASKKIGQVKIVPPDPIEENELPPPENNLIVNDGRYKFPTKNGESTFSVSNFLITPLYLLKDDKNPKRVLLLKNVFGEKAIICCPVKSMTSNNEFAAIVEGKGNFVPNWSRGQFSTIKEHIYQYEDEAQEITVLGHQPETGHYAFSNGIFDGKAFHQVNDYGIARIFDKRYYLPAFSKVNEDADKEYHNERKFIFQAGNTTFSQLSQQLVATFGDNAKIGLCFIVAALFRDIVFSRANCFPILFLFGPSRTGKTTFRHALHRLFGDYGPNDTIGLESASSPKGFARKLAQLRNGLQAFEEYKNKINPNLIGMLKNVYDGIGYERAQTTNDNRTHATLVNSAVIVAGQEMPTKENALFSRVIMLTFGKTSFSKQEKEAFNRLEEMLNGGMGNVLIEIVRHRERMENYFSAEFAQIYGHLRKDPTTNSMEERTLTNIAALLAPFKVLADCLEFPFDYKEIYQVMRERVKDQHRIMSKTNEVNQFWEVFDSLHEKEIIEGFNYGYKNDLLYIDLMGIFPTYHEKAAKQGLDPLPKTTLEQYLKLQPYFVSHGKNQDRMKLGVSPQKRCFVFDPKLMQSLQLNFLDGKI